MKTTALHQELQDLASSLDEHVTPEDVVNALYELAQNVTDTGLSSTDEQTPALYTPEHPRFPQVSVRLVGEDASMLSIVTRVSLALRQAGIPRDEYSGLVDAATAGSYEQGLCEIACWVKVEGIEIVSPAVAFVGEEVPRRIAENLDWFKTDPEGVEDGDG